MPEQPHWDWEIKTETSWFGVSVKELYSYKDLLFRLTRKEFLGSYQQTLLGPFWVLLQPLLTTLIYVLVFNTVIGVSTGDTPPMLFNLIGITLWNLFSEIFLNTAKTFTQNVDIFSKIYFPRIIVALSGLLLQMILFGVQLLFLFAIYLFFLLRGQVSVNLSHIWMIIPAITITAGIGFGGGLIFSVLTAKYRDLMALIQLIIRLLMFVCPIFFTMAMVPERVRWFANLNPLSSQFELFRHAFLSNGSLTIVNLSYSLGFMFVLVSFGVLLFNKMSDKLMDVI
ncbi:MAG TPA: ABC transporter permease [Pedobacter sp.]|jgi:lipopolysaccharide transport system permease protein